MSVDVSVELRRRRAYNRSKTVARYDYYRRLRPRQRAIYRKSDAITKVVLPDPEALRPAVAKLEASLQTEKRTTVLRAARRLVDGVCEALEVPAPKVRVLSRRPSSATSELHGLYERDEDDEDEALAVITVWMRTAAHERVVAFRTFLRTLVHEVGHHLDYELLELADSYHTEGFFRRESSLVRQLAPKPKLETETGPGIRTDQLSLPGL